MPTNEHTIHTDYYLPRTDENGQRINSYTYCRQRLITEVISDLKDVLHTLKDDQGISAHEGAEWIRQDNDERVDFPRGEPFAAMRHGSNEGYLVHIFSFNRETGETTCVITIKYLSDREFSYKVANYVNEALWNAGFFCITPPEYVEPVVESQKEEKAHAIN